MFLSHCNYCIPFCKCFSPRPPPPGGLFGSSPAHSAGFDSRHRLNKAVARRFPQKPPIRRQFQIKRAGRPTSLSAKRPVAPFVQHPPRCVSIGEALSPVRRSARCGRPRALLSLSELPSPARAGASAPRQLGRLSAGVFTRCQRPTRPSRCREVLGLILRPPLPCR